MDNFDRDCVEILRKAKKKELPKYIYSNDPKIEIFKNLFHSECLNGKNTITLRGPAYQDLEITMHGREYLKQLTMEQTSLNESTTPHQTINVHTHSGGFGSLPGGIVSLLLIYP